MTRACHPGMVEGGTLVARRLMPVAERLGDMDAPDLLRAGKIGDRSRNAQHPVKATRAETHRRRSVR